MWCAMRDARSARLGWWLVVVGFDSRRNAPSVGTTACTRSCLLLFFHRTTYVLPCIWQTTGSRQQLTTHKTQTQNHRPIRDHSGCKLIIRRRYILYYCRTIAFFRARDAMKPARCQQLLHFLFCLRT